MLGRVVELTIALTEEEGGLQGGGGPDALDTAVDVQRTSDLKTTRAEIVSAAGQEALELGEALTSAGEGGRAVLPVEVRDVWDHYEATIATRRRAPTAKEIRLIEEALRLRGTVVAKDAITGLSRSPFHNGENDRRKKYLAIRYALSGNAQTGETAEERIDSMAEAAHTQPTNVSQLREGPTQGRVDALKRMILSSWRSPDRPQETDVTMRDRAIADLEALGIGTCFRDGDGWPEFAELDEGLEEIG